MFCVAEERSLLIGQEYRIACVCQMRGTLRCGAKKAYAAVRRDRNDARTMREEKVVAVTGTMPYRWPLGMRSCWCRGGALVESRASYPGLWGFKSPRLHGTAVAIGERSEAPPLA